MKMKGNVCLALISCGLLWLLASCGNGYGANGGGTGNGGTESTGPVRIATDHSVYKPTDAIAVSVLNTLSQPIYALDTRSGCSILDLQMQVNGQWQAATVARCPLGRPAMIVTIASQNRYTVTIRSTFGMPGTSGVTFPTGTYRLLLTYSTTSDGRSITANGVTIMSETFTVSA